MDKLKEVELRRKKLFEEIENFKNFNKQVYEEFLQEKGLDKDAEMLLWIKGKNVWKRGRLYIVESFDYTYAFEFHTYKKNGELSSRCSYHMWKSESIIQKINQGNLRVAKDVE